MKRISIKNFTVFNDLEIALAPEINLIFGANGKGKTHLLKVLYAAAAITAGEDLYKGFERKLAGVFRSTLPNLIRHGCNAAEIIVESDGATLTTVITKNETIVDERDWQGALLEAVYIPTGDVLAHSPGFLSTAARREIAFDETYVDILKRAFLPPLKELDGWRFKLVANLEKLIDGEVLLEGERFFLRRNKHKIEFDLLSEGERKVALLLVLIRNGAISSNSILFWDELSAGMGSALHEKVQEIILELRRVGVQIFLTTRDHVLVQDMTRESRALVAGSQAVMMTKDSTGGVKAVNLVCPV